MNSKETNKDIVPLNLPPYTEMRLRTSKTGKTTVFDVLRRRYITLTPEEWVRQHFINWLTKYKGYPQALMANEVGIHIGDKKLRCDSVLYGRDGQPQVIIEYKAPNIPLTEAVIRQIISYNVIVGVDCLMMSNGLQHICLQLDSETGRWKASSEIPDYGR